MAKLNPPEVDKSAGSRADKFNPFRMPYTIKSVSDAPLLYGKSGLKYQNLNPCKSVLLVRLMRNPCQTSQCQSVLIRN